MDGVADSDGIGPAGRARLIANRRAAAHAGEGGTSRHVQAIRYVQTLSLGSYVVGAFCRRIGDSVSRHQRIRRRNAHLRAGGRLLGGFRGSRDEQRQRHVPSGRRIAAPACVHALRLVESSDASDPCDPAIVRDRRVDARLPGVVDIRLLERIVAELDKRTGERAAPRELGVLRGEFVDQCRCELFGAWTRDLQHRAHDHQREQQALRQP